MDEDRDYEMISKIYDYFISQGNEFFTTENYYGDYTRSNQWFVEKYHIQPPEYKYLENIHMDEVHAEDLKYVLEELNHICHKGKMGDEKEMSVFNLKELDEFVQRTAEAFVGKLNLL